MERRIHCVLQIPSLETYLEDSGMMTPPLVTQGMDLKPTSFGLIFFFFNNNNNNNQIDIQ